MAGIGAVQLLFPGRPGTAAMAHKLTIDILNSDALRFLPLATRSLFCLRLLEASGGGLAQEDEDDGHPVPAVAGEQFIRVYKCDGCGKVFRYLLMCSGCRFHSLCSSQCHKANWPSLRTECRERQRRRHRQQQQERELEQ